MHFGLARFSPRHGWPTPVLYVPGNHEYDGQDFDEAHVRLRTVCEELGITWLERASCTVQGVEFVGTTLWTDFDALVSPGANLTEALGRREKAFRAANYHLRKTGTTRGGQPFLAEAVREQGLACARWLEAALARPVAGPRVVITHFAPSLLSADPRYGRTPGTAAFCWNRDEWLHGVDVWLHGHLHCPHDYRRHGCRVVANPLGYATKGEQMHFDPLRLIDVTKKKEK
jgi:Calcineurin-like phosphoesterase